MFNHKAWEIPHILTFRKMEKKIKNRNFIGFFYYFFHNGIQLFIFLYPEMNYAHDVGQKMENIWNDIGCDDMLASLWRLRGSNLTHRSEILQQAIRGSDLILFYRHSISHVGFCWYWSGGRRRNDLYFEFGKNNN